MRHEAIGYIRISKRGGCYWIKELYVKRDFRERSVGRRLVAYAEDYIREMSTYILWCFHKLKMPLNPGYVMGYNIFKLY
ncbi:MAG TPA: GNAT family N-acetyltransferase [Thermoprotei archaeon]|nr:GNAT family N-acetyltransferase [Thermoprotei archaeon]